MALNVANQKQLVETDEDFLFDLVDDMLECFEMAMNAILDVTPDEVEHVLDIVRDYVFYQYDLIEDEE